MSVVHPERDGRRGNFWRLLGIVVTVGGALLLIAGGIMVRALSGDPDRMFGAFDFNPLGDAVCSACGTARP